MFRRILIANRGEIACRVIRTARRFAIETIAVYSDADVNALHVAMADTAVRLGAAAPSESYLNGGPMKTMPALAQASAKAAFSARKP